MLIDAAHPEETRVAVIDGSKLDKYDFTSSAKVQIKGNIYLGKIVKVEPSLQAAFVDFGGNKHGFLSFTEIHHDYFQIPIGDREELKARIQEAMAARAEESKDNDGDDEIDSREISRLRYQFYRRYKIQEVIKKRQIVLVQVTKEARGVKGAALTTYISLAGRYCVLMPNMAKGNGVSRKISSSKDRQKMKKIVSELSIENGSTVIRTAGVGHTKLEIKKDFEYLKNLWDEIRDKTLHSIAPSLIYEEANIIKRAIRDFYTREIESIVVEGDQGYKFAKDLVKKLMPSHAKKVKLYEDQKLPLFSKYHINEQVNQIYSTRVDLPSGGYLVINTTEALVSIDVNSGKATRARDISGTAIKTNLEAAVEIARQCRLRDLAGLIVVDFIDMDEKRDNVQVERCLREALRDDKARIQVGPISNFGLLEFSRQRLRSSIADTNMICCPHCNGTGVIWSDESIALQILRKIEETCMAVDLCEVNVTLSTEVALYLLNNKKEFIRSIEERGLKVKFSIDHAIATADFRIAHIERSAGNETSRNEEGEEHSDRYKIKNEKKGKSNQANQSNQSSNSNSNKFSDKSGFDQKSSSNQSDQCAAKQSQQASGTDTFEAGCNGDSEYPANNNKKRRRRDKWHDRNAERRGFSVKNDTNNTENEQDRDAEKVDTITENSSETLENKSIPNNESNESAVSISDISEDISAASSVAFSSEDSATDINENKNGSNSPTYSISKRNDPRKKYDRRNSTRTYIKKEASERANRNENSGSSANQVVFDISLSKKSKLHQQDDDSNHEEKTIPETVVNGTQKSQKKNSKGKAKGALEKNSNSNLSSATENTENQVMLANKNENSIDIKGTVNQIIEKYKDVESVLSMAATQDSPLINPIPRKEKKSGWWQKLLKPTEDTEKKS